MGSDTQLRGKDEGNEGLTAAMNRVTLEHGGRPSKEGLRMRLKERSQAAFKFIKPHFDRTAWWTMLVIAVIMIGLDVNARFGGFLGRAIEWARLNVMSQYPSISFIAGMVACYYLVLKKRLLFGKKDEGELKDVE